MMSKAFRLTLPMGDMTSDDRISSKMRELRLQFGHEATLMFKRRGKTLLIPVTVVNISFSIPHDEKDPVTVNCVTVRSELGGELQVAPTDLRHGTVLDRISLALQVEED